MNFVLVLALIVGISSTESAVSYDTRDDCAFIGGVFTSKNISAAPVDLPINDSVVHICSDSKCCTPHQEQLLQKSVMKDLHSLLKADFESLEHLFSSSSDTLAHVLEGLVERSRNKTMNLFSEVYIKIGEAARGPVDELHSTLWEFLQRGLVHPPEIPTSIPPDDSHLELAVRKFYDDMFPAVYHQIIFPRRVPLSEKYTKCLKNLLVAGLKPYSRMPAIMAKDITSSFGEAKAILQALSLGREVIKKTSQIFENDLRVSDSCKEALLKLTYCPKCQGLRPTLKPCNGYCLNVVRGCLTQLRTTDLDLPWSNFLSETVNLIKDMRTYKLSSVDKVLDRLYVPISDGIMASTWQASATHNLVIRACGQDVFGKNSTKDDGVPSWYLTMEEHQRRVSLNVTPTTEEAEASPFWNEMDALENALDQTSTSGFFANLAEVMCSNDSFSDPRDTPFCWNGHKVGEYTKELVRPGFDAQKYNPEMKWKYPTPMSDIEEMAEKLRRMRQLVGTLLSPKLEADSHIRAEYEGSGSGDDRIDSDDEGYSDGEDGSGSGDGRYPPISPINSNEVGKPGTGSSRDPPGTASGPNLSAAFGLVLSTIFVVTFLSH